MDDVSPGAMLPGLWSALTATMWEMTSAALTGRTPHGIRLLGVGLDGIQDALAGMEPRCRTSGMALQQRTQFDPSGRGPALDRASRRRGVITKAIACEAAGHENPFLWSEQPHVRCGPVYGGAILLDRACAILPGLPTTSGSRTAWVVTRQEIVASVCRLWDETAACSRPACDTGWPRCTERQLEVARRRARGWTNHAIARDLGTSVRTVGAELQVIRALTTPPSVDTSGRSIWAL